MKPIKHHLKSAVKQIRRAPYLSLVVALVMTFTFFLTSLFVVVVYSSSRILNYLESKAQISAYFKSDVSEEIILAVKSGLEKSGKVAKVTYVSKEEAMKIYVGEHKDEPALLESISAEIFPPSLEIRAKDISYLGELASQLKNQEGVEEVIFYKDIVDRFRAISRAIKFVGLGLVGSMSLISLLVIILTIGLSIRVRSDEISIMELVGAGDWYISLPYLFQGLLYGLAAGFLSFVVFMVLVPITMPLLKPLLVDVPTLKFGFSFFILLLSGQLIFGAILGALGSLLGTMKFLRK